MSSRWWWVAMMTVAAVAWGERAHAQDPDVRSLTPVVMIVLDTSGSMEGVPSGVKPSCPLGHCPGNPASNLCPECYPDCGAGEKNRWALAVEALSGTFTNFTCTPLDRDQSVFTYDYGYIAPHHALPPPVTTCTPPLGPECSFGLLGALGIGVCLPLLNTCQGGSNQNDDGVLDAYLNDVRFGLLTFDSMYTYRGASTLVPDYEFSDPRSESSDGMFSFGGPKDLTYPNCLNTYRVDTGVRSATASEGRLISAGTDSSNWQAINAQIQAELRSIRPVGSTPIAAALSDLDYYFRNHPDMTTDAYSACRGRYGVLITDGKPDDDFREYDCDLPGFTCPYRLPEDEAGVLRCGASNPTCGAVGGNGSVSKLFVIGLDVTDPAAQAQLDEIAARGGNLEDPMTMHEAIFASTGTEIVDALAEILDETQAFPISRTTPITVRSRTNRSYRITAAFERPGGGLPWNGLLERQELGCGANPDAPVTTSDRFHETLNLNNARTLFTALPSSGSATPNDYLAYGNTGDACGTAGCPLSTFDSTCAFCSGPAINNTHTLTADAAAFGTLANWVHGRPGSGRELIKLGAIYHSTPAFVEAPKRDISDASLTLARASGPFQDRPDMLYVGTNDGILHAFQLESATGGGEELWGFIPPMLLDKLNAAMTSPQIMLDGTPVAKNVFFSRYPGTAASGSEYRTVLVSGMRQGGNGYFALDVTDPTTPRFLWQFADPNFGFTYGRPALAQILVDIDGTDVASVPGETPNGTLMQRAVALLPGGTGMPMPGACDSARDSGGNPFATFLDSSATPAPGPTHRSQHRCWSTTRGRYLYFVDVKTGHVIHKFDDSTFPSPLVGTPAVFNAAEGALGTRAFVADADGVLWRIDFSNPDPDFWTAVPFHDMAWGLGADQGEPGYEPPVLSLDNEGRVVVLFAQGNQDNFENPSAINRVVSLTEIFTDPTNTTGEFVKAGFNWEHQLDPSEMVTGPLELFDGALFYATFRPVTGGPSANACDEGRGNLYAVDFITAGATVNPTVPATPRPSALDGIGSDFNTNLPPSDTDSPGLFGRLVMGLSVVQKPLCDNVATINAVNPAGWTSPATVSAGPPTYEVVGNTASGTDQAASSDIGQIRRTFTKMPRMQVLSWAGGSD